MLVVSLVETVPGGQICVGLLWFFFQMVVDRSIDFPRIQQPTLGGVLLVVSQLQPRRDDLGTVHESFVTLNAIIIWTWRRRIIQKR